MKDSIDRLQRVLERFGRRNHAFIQIFSSQSLEDGFYIIAPAKVRRNSNGGKLSFHVWSIPPCAGLHNFMPLDVMFLMGH